MSRTTFKAKKLFFFFNFKGKVFKMEKFGHFNFLIWKVFYNKEASIKDVRGKGGGG